MNKLIIAIVALLLIVFGFFLGKGIDWPFFSIEKSINLVDVLSILITSYIAYYVVRVLEKKGTEDRHEKDLILSRIGELESIIQQCSVDMSDGEISYTDASAYFGKSTLLTNRIFMMITIATIECDADLQTQLINTIRVIRDLSTNTPRIPSAHNDLTVIQGVIRMSANRLYDIEQKFEELRSLIFRFQVNLNRA